MKLRYLIATYLFISRFTFASGSPPSLSSFPSTDPCPPPWFTGPLLTPSGHVVPGGYINVEPYIFYTVRTGKYDSDWSSFSIPNFTNVTFQVPLYIGLTKWSNILIVPSAGWNQTQEVSSLEFNDFHFEFDVQILQDTHHNRLPGLKAYVQEIFPTGHYQKRDPEKLGTDIGGTGSFRTRFGFILTQLIEFQNCHYLSWRWNFFYTHSLKVNVKGINFYGGFPNTDAKITPRPLFGTQLGIEYTLSQNWVLACDFEGIVTGKDKVSGFPGTTPDGSLAVLGRKSSIEINLAPAMEYNFSEALGILGGIWFSVAGRNSARFISGVIAINYFGPVSKSAEHRYRFSGGGAASGVGGGGGSGGR